MSFREKSASVMAILMTSAALYYLTLFSAASRAVGTTVPSLAIFIPYVIFVVAASVVAQVALALFSPKEASAPADERERIVEHRAGNWSGIVLSVLVVSALGNFIVYNDGTLLFHLIMGGLMTSQISDYIFRIILLRRSL